MKKSKLLLGLLLLISGSAFTQSTLVTTTLHKYGTAFTCIAVDQRGNVWAGTNKLGLFYLDNSVKDPAFVQVPATAIDFSKLIIQSLAADSLENLWVGHAGYGGGSSAGGGIEKLDIRSLTSAIHFSPDRNAQCMPSFFQRNGLATLNVSSIVVDRYNTVWATQKSHSLVSNSEFILTPGTLSSKRANSDLFVSKSTWESVLNGEESPELPYPAYTCKIPISRSPGTRRCESVGCSNTEVWMSVFPYEHAIERSLPGSVVATEYLQARILRYDLNGDFLGQYTFEDIGATTGGIFNAIYLTTNSNAWVGLTGGKGVGVRIKGCWYLLNSTTLSGIFVAGTEVNVNAIWGNNQGQVFIGTNKGLIVYNGVGKIDDETSYTALAVGGESNLIVSNNVTGGCSQNDTVQWVATDLGINRIVSGNKFSIDPNYTYCKNPAIDVIEEQVKSEQKNHLDWHSYQVETEVCNSSGPNKNNCNAQYVYNMMKADASLTAPTPIDFPFDLDPLNVGFLKLTADQLDDFAQRIAAQKAPILSVVFLYVNTLESLDQNTKKIPFGNLLNNNKDYLALQKSANAFGVVPCGLYKLYNNSSLIIGRTKYNKYIDNTICGNQLESLEYDPVWIYPDDKNLVITNYTAPGHFLSPGKIERRVIEECGTVKIITKGTGRQYCGDNLMGKIAGIGNVLTGTIVFKNIDLRLKAAFSNQ